MNKNDQHLTNGGKRLRLNLAIVGAGKLSRFFLDRLHRDVFPMLDVNIVGVCDIDPRADGFCRAKELGIYTTNNFRDLFKIEDLDAVIELTNDRDFLLELIRSRPRGLVVLDHNILKVFISLYNLSNQQLKSKEKEIVLEKMVSELLMKQASERIVLLDPNFTIVEANEGYLSAVNKSREEVIGEKCYKITHGYSSPCSEWEPDMGCPLVESLKTGQASHIIHEHVTDNDERTYCDLQAYPIKDDSGQLVRIIEIWKDVTKELASRWEMRVKELKTDMGKIVREDRLISLGRLAASCAHEINNPIHGLLTFAHLMKSILNEDDPTPDDLTQFKEHLSLMCKELERCGDIVSGLLSFSRESSMEAREVEVNGILREVITLIRHKIELRNITLFTDLTSEALLMKGDVHQLQQCFLNLVFNAIDAIPDGGSLLVTSGKVDAENHVQIIFQDSGYGIEEKDLEHIFDPFFTTKPEGEGTGLGLSIVYGIVKEHDGEIEVKSRVGEGSTFILSFPGA